MLESDPKFTFIKMAIDRVKQYARENKCHIEEACGPVTGVALDSYNEALQFMISSGHRYNIYNKVKIRWNDFDLIRNYEISRKYPKLYREITVPEITVTERMTDGTMYCLSDQAYNEWCDYQRDLESNSECLQFEM